MTPSSVASARARFVVTGIGRVTPFGNSWPEYTQGDLGGVDKHSYCRVPPFRIRDHLDRLRLPLPMRFSQLAMLAASHALNQASLTATNTRTVATIISTDFGPMGAVTTFLRSLHSSDGSYPSPLLFSRATANVALGDVARYWSLQGPSSLVFGDTAVGYALEILARGHAPIVLCGGVDELTEEPVPIVSLKRDPGGTSGARSSTEAPLIESAFFLVLETAESASGRGVVPLLRIRASASSLVRTGGATAAMASTATRAMADAGWAGSTLTHLLWASTEVAAQTEKPEVPDVFGFEAPNAVVSAPTGDFLSASPCEGLARAAVLVDDLQPGPSLVPPRALVISTTSGGMCSSIAVEP